MSRRPAQVAMATIPKKTRKIHQVVIPSRAETTQNVILIARLIVTIMFTMIMTGAT